MLDIKTANNKIWITRPEAAAMLGVSPQTVSNYAARGILQEKKGKPYNWYIRKEVEQLATIPELTDIELQRQALLAEQAELQELRTTIQKQRDNARTAFLLAFGGRHKYARCKEVVQACIDTIFAEGDRIAGERDRNIIQDVLNGYGLEEIADYYDLTTSRVHQIILKTLRRMKRFPQQVAESRRNLICEIETLREEKANLERALSTMAQYKGPQSCPEKKYYSRIIPNVPPFSLRLDNLTLSIRAINCMRAADIETLGDLAQHERSQIVRIRNLGRRTLCELDMALEQHGLTYGMKVIDEN